jgi:hypothetical protein
MAFQKDSERQWVRKATRVGIPCKRENAKPLVLKPWGSKKYGCREMADSKEREGKRKREMLFFRHHGERNPRGQKAQESIASHFELNVWGGKGCSFSEGIKPLKRADQVDSVWNVNARAQEGIRKSLSILGEDKSSEERSPRALRVERHSQGQRTYSVERVTKP